MNNNFHNIFLQCSLSVWIMNWEPRQKTSLRYDLSLYWFLLLLGGIARLRYEVSVTVSLVFCMAVVIECYYTFKIWHHCCDLYDCCCYWVLRVITCLRYDITVVICMAVFLLNVNVITCITGYCYDMSVICQLAGWWQLTVVIECYFMSKIWDHCSDFNWFVSYMAVIVI